MMFDQVEAIETFRAFAREQHGVLVPENPKIGRIGLCPVEGKKPSNRAGRYRLHLDGIAAGWVQNWTCEDRPTTWCLGKKLDYSPADWGAYQAQVKALEREREEHDARRSADVEALCVRVYDASPKCTSQPYLDRKDAKAVDGLRVTDREWEFPRDDGEPPMKIRGGALIVPAFSSDGKLRTLQFIYADGTKLFPCGAKVRGHFVIGKPGDVVAVAESYTTGWTIHAATGYAVYVSFGSGNLFSVAQGAQKQHPGARIVVCGDDDWKVKGNPGKTRAEAAAKPIGAAVWVPEFGPDRGEKDTDANDLAALHGLPAVKRQIEAVLEQATATEKAPEGGKPQIVVTTNEPAVIDRAIAALARAPEAFVRGAEIVEIVTDDPATRGLVRAAPLARIHRSPEARIREILAREADWVTFETADQVVDVHPPVWAVRAVMARGHWPRLRPLVGVSEAPTMRPDGSILAEPGYDPATGIYLAPTVQVSIPDRPTHDQAVAAAAELADVIADFPVASEAGRSAWMAGVITSAVRPAIDGPTPMIVVDASVPGAGKTLAADAAATITTGRPAARTTFVVDDAEMRKRITALALVGDPLALLDNVVGTLGCPSLDAALTGTTWRDRVLGASQMTAELPLQTVWWATGNGLIIGADLVRRALLIRLEPMTERPEERTGWRHPRLIEYVRDHRSALLGDALTIARAYVVAGRPDQGLTPMGSYTAWSDLARSAVVWAGLPDPCATIGELRAIDPRMDALRGVIDAWPVAQNAPIGVTELLDHATTGTPWRAAVVEWCPPRGTEPLPTARAMGTRLRGVRRRVVDGRYIDAAPKTRAGVAWLMRGVCDYATVVTVPSATCVIGNSENGEIADRTVTTVTQSHSDNGRDLSNPDGEEIS